MHLLRFPGILALLRSAEQSLWRPVRPVGIGQPAGLVNSPVEAQIHSGLRWHDHADQDPRTSARSRTRGFLPQRRTVPEHPR